jgi:protein arginine kinase
MKEKIELPSSLIEHNPWENYVNPIWPASTFILHRNLARYNFPIKMNARQFEQTQDILKKALQDLGFSNPKVLPADQLSPLDKEFLFEHFLCLEGFEDTIPGQAFVVDGTNQFLAMVNIHDHLLLYRIDCKDEWEKAWNSLSNIETEIGKKLDYAFSSKFGYLTSDPALCGTGLIVLVYLHLPSLVQTGQLQEILIKQKEEEIEAIGILGTLDELLGDLVILRNNFTLGLSEENILHSLHSAAMKLVVAEQTLRSLLKKENNVEIKDHVSRAYGLLTLSYQIQAKEALNALSLLKLGVDLGWISGITDQKMNDIFFNSRRAHLAYALKSPLLSPEETPRKRAEYLHAALKGTTINI